MDLGLGVSFDNPVFAGDFCQAFGLGLRAERFADLPVWWPKGSRTRLMRQAYSVLMGQMIVAPAATAGSKAACRSAWHAR